MKPTADSIRAKHDQRGGLRCIRHRVRRQVGLTLVELIIGLAIISLIGGGTAIAVHQLLTATRQANDQQYAVSQLRQAEHYMTRDVLMTWKISSSGFPLELYWEAEDEDGDTYSYQVTYSLVGSADALKRMNRAIIVTNLDTNVQVEASTLAVAQGILESSSETVFVAPNLTVTLVAVSGTHEELRTFEVKPRKTEIEET